MAPIENIWNRGEDHIDDLALAELKWRNGAKRNAANYTAWAKVVKKGIRKVKRSQYGKVINSMPGRLVELIAKKGWRIKP